MLKKILKDKGITGIYVGSAGIEANPEYKIYGYLADVMRDAGIDFSDHVSTQFTEEHARMSDMIFVMEKRQKKFILDKYPAAGKKVFLLREYADCGETDIEDPIFKPAPAHKSTLEEINDCLKKIMPKII